MIRKNTCASEVVREKDCEWISFSAEVGEERVRLTIPLADLDIVSSDNIDSYDVTREQLAKLDAILFEDVY